MPPFVKPFVSVSTSSTPRLFARRDRVREQLGQAPRRKAQHGRAEDVRRHVLKAVVRLTHGENDVAIRLWRLEQEGVGKPRHRRSHRLPCAFFSFWYFSRETNRAM